MEIKNIGQLIQHLAAKAGVSADDPNLINVLSNADISKVPIHSDLVKAVDENLLSVDAALDNHPTVKNKYTAEILNGVDKKLEAIMTEAGFDDAEAEEMKGIKSTYKRIEAIHAKIAEKQQAALDAQKKALEDAGKSTTDEQVRALKAKEEEYLQQLREASEKLKSAAKEKAEALTAKDTEFAQFKINQERRLLLASIGKTIYDDLDADTKILTINAILDRELQDKEAEFYFDDQKGFSIRKKDLTAFVGANHTAYTPQRFIDELLAQKKILKVTEGAPEGGNAGGSGGGTNNPQNRSTIDAGGNGPEGQNQTARATAKLNRELREKAEQRAAETT